MALGSYFVIILILCLNVKNGQFEVTYSTASEEQQNESSIDPILMMRSAKVVLHPPEDITFFLITSNEVVVGWLPPKVYTVHDVNTSLIDPPYNASVAWLNHTHLEFIPTSDNKAETEAKPGSSKTPVNGTGVTEAPSASGSESAHEICRSLDYFENYTVDVNETKTAGDSDSVHLIKLVDVYRPTNATADLVNNEIVSFSQGCVIEYRVFYNDSESEFVVQVNVSERPEVHLTSLKPGTKYSIHVSAVFVSNRVLNSTTVLFETAAVSGTNNKCQCDWHGTLQKNSECSQNLTHPCSCRHGYEGKFCERCSTGFYRTAPYFPCNRCPCAHHATRDATCKFKEGFLVCAQCEVGYTGNICHMCQYGYYRHQKYCVPCHCNTNHNQSHPHMCDMVTGACFCSHNTSGFHCESCHEGYDGDALHFKNCTLKNSGMNMFKVLPQGVVAAICVGVVLFLSFVVGCVIYCRMSKNPPKRPFWTVELKDDHEGVNFNTVPNDDFHVIDPKMAAEDMEFYEQQGGAAQSHGGGSAGKKYARLHENV